MKDELISFETAKLAKEKGFIGIKSQANNWYYENGDIHNEKNIRGYKGLKGWNAWEATQGVRWDAPTQSLLKRWLRDNDVDITIITNFKNSSTSINKSYRVGIVYIKNNLIETFFLRPKSDSILDKVLFTEFKTYEDALEYGLKEALKII